MNKKILVANWKMNLGLKHSLKLALFIASAMKNTRKKSFVLLPSTHAIYCLYKQKTLKNIKLGAQDCSQFISGAYTGDISAEMLKEVGAKYILVGHSERRLYNLEENKVLKNKLLVSQSASLNIIFCVGESLRQYKQKKGKEFVRKQLSNIFPSKFNFEKLIIAYEPVWAIGKNRIPKIQEIREISEYIKKFVYKKYNFDNIPILYGGSVNSKNSAAIFNIKSIDGALVGGASLNASEFKKIYDTLN